MAEWFNVRRLFSIRFNLGPIFDLKFTSDTIKLSSGEGARRLELLYAAAAGAGEAKRNWRDNCSAKFRL